MSLLQSTLKDIRNRRLQSEQALESLLGNGDPDENEEDSDENGDDTDHSSNYEPSSTEDEVNSGDSDSESLSAPETIDHEETVSNDLASHD